MKLTYENLKWVLWETLKGVKQKEIGHAEASAVASQAREILRAVKTEKTFGKDIIENDDYGITYQNGDKL